MWRRQPTATEALRWSCAQSFSLVLLERFCFARDVGGTGSVEGGPHSACAPSVDADPASDITPALAHLALRHERYMQSTSQKPRPKRESTEHKISNLEMRSF